MRARSGASAALALVPMLAIAQVQLGGALAPSGTVVGRACLDLDGDGRCGPGEPGIAGARILLEGGEVALADGEGRFHLLEVPARAILADRAAYGGHAAALEGFPVRRIFEIPPAGAAAVDLAARDPGLPVGSAAPRAAAPAAPVRSAGRVRWAIAGQLEPGGSAAVDGIPAAAGPDSGFLANVMLSPRENRFTVEIRDPGGVVSFWTVPIFLAPRKDGGDLVLPAEAERLAVVVVEPGRGGALVHGAAGPGVRIRIGGLAPVPGAAGRFAAWIAGRSEAPIELLGEGGTVLARREVPLRAEDGVAAAVGLAEVELSLGKGGALVAARGAASTRGRIGPAGFEAGVDLDDRDRALTDLVRPRDGLAIEHAPSPTRAFPTGGDEGAAGDRNPGRGRVWARAETDGAQLDLGAARAGLTGQELGRYDRAFFGGKVEARGAAGPVQLEGAAFGATLRADATGAAPPVPAHDALAATGGSLFWLSHADVAPGSEALRIEWRDPWSGRAGAQKTLVRGIDYAIDYPGGWVILAAPLSTVAPPANLATADPFTSRQQAVLVADYLRVAPGPGADDLQGGRVAGAVGPVRIAAQGAAEDRTAGSYHLGAASAEIDLGAPLRVRAEVARSRGAPFASPEGSGFSRSLDGGLTFAAPAPPASGGIAFQVEAGGAAGGARWNGWWRERRAGYADAEFQEVRDARERGADAALEGEAFAASVAYAERRGTDPRDPAGMSPFEARRAAARATVRRGPAEVTAEVSREEEIAPLRGQASGAGLRAGWRIAPSLVADASWRQGFAVSGASRDPTFGAIGAAWEGRDARVAAQAGWGPDLGPRVLLSGERRAAGEAIYGGVTMDPEAPSLARSEGATLGVRRREGAAEVFTEEQFARDAFGLRAGRVFGATLQATRGLAVTVLGERGARERPDGTVAGRSALGATVSWVVGPLRLSGRGEGRDDGGTRQWLAGGSAEWRTTERLSFAARADGSRGFYPGGEALLVDAGVGMAWRSDRASMLARLSRVLEQRPGTPRRDAVLAGAALAGGAGRVTLGAGLDVGLARIEQVRDDRIAASARVGVRITGPMDGAIEYARRARLGPGRLGDLDAVRAEVGAALGAAGRLALGYTLFGFEGDGVDPASERGRLYLRATLGALP